MAEMLGAFLDSIFRSLAAEIHNLGFPPGAVALPDRRRAHFGHAKDNYSGKENLNVVLCDSDGQRRGQIQFNSDDGFFAEFDVLRPHPGDPRWFVEGVIAWGHDGAIKSEPKLIPAV